LGVIGQRINGLTVDELHRQNLRGGQIVPDLRHDEIFAQRGPKTGQRPRLAHIVGLVMQLRARGSQKGRDIDIAGQDTGQTHKAAQSGNIAVYAARDAGKLHLDRQIAPVACNRAVHLPDRGRRQRPHLEPLEAGQPVRPPSPRQNLFKLRRRHGRRIGLKLRQGRAEFGRQRQTAIHGQHLPQLHRRAAQGRQTTGHPQRIGRRQRRAPQIGPLPAQDLICQAHDRCPGEARRNLAHPK